MNSQASVTDQLQSLIKLANKAGLYDAADWLVRALESRLTLPETPSAKASQEVVHLVSALLSTVPDELDSSGAFQTIDLGVRLAKVVHDWISTGKVRVVL